MATEHLEAIPERSLHPHAADALRRATSPYAVHEHRLLSRPIQGPTDVAVALGIAREQIAKTLFLTERGGTRRATLLCCSWNARADLAAAAHLTGYEPLELGSLTALSRILGYPPGGVSPLGAPPEVPVLMDARLLLFPAILVGAGKSGVEIELAPLDLRRITRAIVGLLTV